MMHHKDIRDDHQHYQSLGELCRIFLPVEQNWQIAFVRSLNMETEATPFSGRHVLIFDMRLIAALKALTRIFYYDGNRRLGFGYFGRLVACESLIVGEIELARRAFSDFIRLSQRSSGLYDPYVNKAMEHFDLQELFIILHECCHIMLATGHEMAENFRGMADLLTEDGRAQNWLEQMHATILRDFPGRLSKEKLRADTDAQQQFISDNKKLVREEFACDYFAIATLYMYAESHKIATIELFKAICLCFQSVKLLRRVRAYVRQLQSGETPTGIDHCVRLVEARERKFITGHFPAIIETSFVNFTVNDLGRELTLLSDRFARRVENPLFLDYLTRLSCVRMDSVSREIGSNSFEEHASLAKTMGWNKLWIEDRKEVEESLYVL